MRRIRLPRPASALLASAAIVAAGAWVGLASAAPGDLDPGFDADGVVVASPGTGGNSSAAALVYMPNGALQVAGRAVDGGAVKAMLARFTPAGAPDPSFASGGPVLVAIGSGGQAEVQAMARDAAGRLVVAGFARDAGVAKMFVARFTGTGAVDATFNAAGAQPGVRLVEPRPQPTEVTASGLALDSQGRILVAGSAVDQTGERAAFVARLTGAGALDDTFAPTGVPRGVAVPAFTGVSVSRANDVAIDAADRPVIAGSATDATGVGRLLVARLSSGGALDPAFDSDGFAVTPLGDGGDPRALALELVGGKPTLVGSALDAGARKLALARYTADGALDPGLGGAGTVLEAIGSGGQAEGTSLAVDSDGRLVVAGSALNGGQTRVMVARLSAAGGLDPSFASGGVALTPPGSANAVALQGDGKVVAAGQRARPLGGTDVLLARYLTADPPPAGQPPEPPVEDGPPPLLGPSAVTFGEPALFTAPPTRARIVDYRWELDGDGDFNEDGAKRVRHAFDRPGKVTVGLRTLDGAGRQREYSQSVTVDPPLLSQLVWSPVNPRPGQKVTFKLANLHGRHSPISHFSWDFGGLKPVKPRLRLPLHGVPHRRGPRASAAAGPPQIGTAVLVSKGTDLTAKNKFTRRFPRAGVFPVAVSAVTDDGIETTTQADIAVGTKSPQVGPTEDTISATECAEEDDLACPQISVSGYELEDFPITFSSQAPKTEGNCTQLVAGTNKFETIVKQKIDLGYPATIPQSGGPLGELGAQPGVAGVAAKAGAPPVAHAAQNGPCVEELLEKAKKKFEASKATVTPVQWNFGDGTKAPAVLDPDGKAPEVLTHTYDKAGTYNVSLIARVTKQNSTEPGSQQSPGLHAAKTFFSTWYVKKTIKLRVVGTHCGPVKLNGIPVKTSDNCFIQIDPPQPLDAGIAAAAKTVCCTSYRPFAGDYLIMGGVTVDARSNWIEPVVHPSGAKITAIDPGGWESGLYLGFRWGPGGYENNGFPDLLQLQPVSPGDTLAVPKAQFIPELGQKAVDLPYGPFTGEGALTSPVSNEIAGLPVKGGHFFLFPDKPALARLTLKLPNVFTGTGEVGLNPIQAAGSGNDEVDFTMQLPDASIGPFETEGVEINHRKLAYGGGWFGGGTILLFGAGLDAPYVPPGQSSAVCGKGGPSGFALSEGGSFEHGGATLKLPSDLHIVPPWVGFNCLQVAGTKKPFTLQGKVGLHVPVNGVIGVNACFLIAILEDGDKASGCGANNYTAKQAETWFRAAGAVTLFDDWELASAYFDLHKGNDLFKVAVGGGFDWDLVIVSVSASVQGLVYFEPDFAFQFYGKGEICLTVVCPNIEALVSSKGVAGCASIAGFEYNWDDGSAELFGGCDLSETSVYISSKLPLPLVAMSRAQGSGPAPLGATRRARVRVPKGRRAISFEVDGAGGAPLITVTDPRGRKYVDNGRPVQGDRRSSVLHVERARQSILTVRGKPPAGVWTIETQPDSAAIAGLSTRRDLPPTRVRARVRGRGAARRLVYRVARVPGQRVIFLEQGRTVGRRIGVATQARGSLRFPKGYGTAGKRRVLAIVEQDGMPRRRIPLTTYVAPKPPRVPAPRLVRARIRRAGLQLRWRPVRAAAKYRLLVKVGDGRVLKRTVRRAATRIPFYDARLGARVSVVAEAKDTRVSGATKLRVKPKRTRRVVVRI